MSKIILLYFNFWGDFRVFFNYNLLFLITFVFFSLSFFFSTSPVVSF